tara:strand:+ start:154 stop:528 length:375 start_codon:yes stop_codon:yes gene_type:complete
MSKKIWLIDIDGTVCDDVPNETPELFETAGVYPDALDQVNKWYDAGDTVYFFTARLEEHRGVTEKWMEDNGFRYHGILFNKPRIKEGQTYHWVDNRPVKATQYIGTFGDMVKETREIEVFNEKK